MAIIEIQLTFYKGRDNKLIARNKNGKVCLIDFTYCKEHHIWVQDGEAWNCFVKREEEKFMIVQPISRLKTADENKAEEEEMTVKLREKYKKESPARRVTSNR
jgi:hypothetical protein